MFLEIIYTRLIGLGAEFIFAGLKNIIGIYDELAVREIDSLGSREFHGVSREGADNEELFALIVSLIYEELIAVSVILPEITVNGNLVLLAEFEKLAVVIENGLGILLRLLNVYILIIRIDIEPGLVGGCEARVFARIPLNRRSCVFAADLRGKLAESLLIIAEQLMEETVIIEGHYILIFIKMIDFDICHTDFLTLIDERSAALKSVHCREHFAALNSEFYVAVSVDDSRVVVILDIEAVPSPAVHLSLPVVIDLLELSEAERALNPVNHKAVAVHMIERNQHIELLIRALGTEGDCILETHLRTFADGKAAVLILNGAEFIEILLEMRAVFIMLYTGRNRKRNTVGKSLRL